MFECLLICLSKLDVYDLSHIIPDHNLLMWFLDLSPYLCMNTVRIQQSPSADFVKYALTNIPPDFLMRSECVTHIQDCIRLFEIGTEEQQQLNEGYDKFCNFVKSIIKLYTLKKAYWSENLSVL